MANINVQVPDVAPPSYLGLSHPISQPRPDTTLGTAVSSVGNVIGVAAQGVDFLIKDTLKEQITPKIEGIQEEYRKQLEATSAQIAEGKVPAGVSAPVEGEGGPGTPPDLTHLGRDLIRLREGNKAGSLSQTDYIARLATAIKPYRDKFAGHRDYIDKIASGIVGFDIANAHIKSLTADINRSLAAAGTTKNRELKILEELTQTGDPRVKNVILPLYKAGKIGYFDLVEFQNDIQHVKWKADQSRYINDDDKNSREFKANVSKDSLATEAYTETKNTLGLLLKSQTEGGLLSPEERTALTEIQAGRGATVSAQARENLRTSLGVIETNLRNKLLNSAGSQGAFSSMGPEKVKDHIDTVMLPFKNIQASLGAGDYSEASRQTRYLSALIDDTTSKALGNPDVRAATAKGGAAKQLFGGLPNYTDIINKLTLPGTGKLVEAFNTLKVDGVATQGTRPPTEPAVMNKIIKESEKLGILSNEQKQNLENWPNVIKDETKDARARAGFVTFAFHPENRSFIFQIKDPKDQLRMFKNLSSKEMTDAVFKLATDPKLQSHERDDIVSFYVSWVDHTQNRMMNEDVQKLSALLKNPNVAFVYNDKTHKFILEDPLAVEPTGILDPGIAGERRRALARQNEVMDRINTGVQALVPIAEKQGQDPATAVFQALTNQGLDLKGSAAQLNIPAKMLDAVTAERVNRKREEVEKEAERQRRREEHGKTFRQR